MSDRPVPANAPARVAIESVSPSVDAGRFAVKRTKGESVDVTADLFADGHDAIAAVVRYRLVRSFGSDAGGSWQEAPMTHVDNDRWAGRFVVSALGRWEFTIEAWVDAFRSWRLALVRRAAASQVAEDDLVEGATLVREAAARAREAAVGRRSSQVDADVLDDLAAMLGEGGTLTSRVERALDEKLDAVVGRYPDRRSAARLEPSLTVEVERVRARTGAWYEMFPRSEGAVDGRSGTFASAQTRLPEIAAMGFDVVYLPPIHPIGVTGRKGRGNTLVAASGDPGSPWAIGSSAGGHTAVHPDLGTLESFDEFVSTARRAGLEVALDLAYQCSPDHPYVREHPAWFRHRPDGTIKFAENPPKKYQDIYPLDFDSAEWRSLWHELFDVVMFWTSRGIRIFRVDNPHTKPFRFWEWLIAGVRERHPDVVFLSEAFTKPKVMRHLAKLGFSQSYTYFTWRNTKWDLTEYFTEITAPAVLEYFRPNLFVNTPDILSPYLQTGGRPAFQARLVLAATLGASYGIYSGFELCEAESVAGTEEYLGSEKYQFKPRDWDRPGHIRDLIRTVNRIRRSERALQVNSGLTFLETDNPEIIAFSKVVDGSGVFVTINLDPHRMQHGTIRAPLAQLNLDPAGYGIRDLLDGARYTWHGERGYVKLDPSERVAHIFKPERPAPGAGLKT
jgi:starch synthase (maltosyl-transferring)